MLMMVLNRLLATAVILCLLTGNILAQPPLQKYTYWRNYGGLNDSLSNVEIADNEASDIQNIIFDTGGTIKKRYGSLTIPNTTVTAVATGSITGLNFYKKNNGNRYLVAVLNDTANKATVRKKDYATGGGWSDTSGWSLIEAAGMPSGYSTNYLADFAVAEDNLILTFNATVQVKPYKWTGSGVFQTLTSDSDCPVVTMVEYHKNQLFLTGNNDYPSRVYFSRLDDITDYTATDFFDVATSDGTRVRGIISAFNSLYIFKDKSIWRLAGTNRDDFSLEQMVVGVGTLSQQSIAVVNNSILFTTSQNDIAAYDGGYTILYLSAKIKNTLANLDFSRATNNLGIAFSTYRNTDCDYYVSCTYSGSATNNRILFFDTFYKAWSKFVGLNANAWCVAENSSGKNILVYGDNNGYVHYYPSTNYYDTNTATSPITAFYQTKWFSYPELCLGDKYWRLLKTYALTESTANTELIVECKSDYEDSGKILTIDLKPQGSLWDIAVWDVDLWGGQNMVLDRKEVEKGYSLFQVRYSDSDINEGFTILGFETFIEPTSRI